MDAMSIQELIKYLQAERTLETWIQRLLKMDC